MKKLDVDICKKLRQEGHTYQEIADYFEVSRQAVFEALDKAGMPRKTKYSQYYSEWEELYQNGMATHKIAEKYNCSYRAVYDYLSKKFVIERGQLMKKRGKKKLIAEKESITEEITES